ncbi:MAG TPA: ABC transporter substrate-binding protein [Pirellulales bacterium]|nr:ABC transporter substrate-binding protein [Pirellulales bacterium]
MNLRGTRLQIVCGSDGTTRARCLRYPGAALNWLLALLCWTAPGSAHAWQETPSVEEAKLPIFEQEAYDEIVLNDEARTVIKVRPLDLPQRRAPDPASFPKGKKLIVKQIEDPSKDYEVKWGDIAEVRLFEYIVLDEARALVRQGRDDPATFDEAYPYFDYLKRTYPRLEGLTAALADYLYEDAGVWHEKRKKYENALALLNELYELDPQYPKLPGALGATTQKLMEPYLARGDYPAARRLLGRLAKKFPQSPVVTKYHEQWADEARQLMNEGRRHIAEGEPRKAWELARRVLYVWPRSPDAKKFFEELYTAWPRVVVGVTAPSPPASSRQAGPASRLASWAERRYARLLNRMLVEFTGTGAEGGEYACPFGQLERTDIGRRLIFRLKRDIKWSADGTRLTGYDVARQLLTLADPRELAFRPTGLGPAAVEPTWAELFGGVSVQDVYQVDVELRWSYVQPLALLETPIAPLAATTSSQGIGPYLLEEASQEKTHFLSNPAYFAAQPGQLREVVEQYLPNSQSAWQALDRGFVQVVDRLSPWEVERYRANRDFVVGQYALPTIHCLLPNLERPFMKHRCFRRAMAYAIDRDLVLKHHLLHDQKLTGYQLVSGPFPIGNGFDDPLRYAYNNEVEQRFRNPRLAIALAQVALHDLSEAAKKRDEPEIKEFPRLVLAHPANDIAREACKGIQRHIEGLKFKVDLRELEPGVSLPGDGDYDLLYLETTIQEPLVDAARLLGPDGIVGEASAYMTLALVQLAKATNWQEARQILQRIHRLTADDVAIIPLWQMPEYFAYHRSLKGIDPVPVLLYQNVESWKGSVQVPVEDF